MRRKLDNNFRELAKQLGLNAEIPSTKIWKVIAFDIFPKLEGKINGFDVKIFPIMKGSGKSKTMYTIFDIHITDKSENNLKIYHEGFFRKFGKMLGIQKDIEINDPDFDGRYIVRSNNSDYAKTILSDMILKNKLIEQSHLLNNGEIKFENGILHYEGIKSLYHKKEIYNLELLVKLAILMAETIQSKLGKKFE